MTCSFCGTRNADGETRCRRCGRKPGDTLRYPYQTQGALATMPKPEPVEYDAAPAIARSMPAHPVQKSLFPDQGPKVIPIAPYAPQRTKALAPAKPRIAKPRVSRRVETQAELDFLPAASGPKKLGTTVDAVIFCDAPVATRLHRAVATVLDLSLILIAYGLFLLAYWSVGGDFNLNKTTLLMLGGMLALIAFTYGLFWALGGTETCGQKWVHLRLINFDGFPPEPKQRLLRFAGSCLSVCTCCLGLLWGLADEESLTWQDHMSRTFLTAYDLDAQVFRRV